MSNVNTNLWRKCIFKNGWFSLTFLIMLIAFVIGNVELLIRKPGFCFVLILVIHYYHQGSLKFNLSSVWPDWAIYWTLGDFLKPLATINLPKYPTFLGNFCKGLKIYKFSSEIIFMQLLKTFGDFFWSHCLSYTIIPLGQSYQTSFAILHRSD